MRIDPARHKRLVDAVLLAFHDDRIDAPAALRAFLEEGRGWKRIEPELPAGSHSWGQLVEAAAACLVRFDLVDDELFDRMVARAPAARQSLEFARSELLYPERLPPKWRCTGPEGGAVERIAVDPHEPSRLLCCVHIGVIDPAAVSAGAGHRRSSEGARSRLGLFRSVDRGATWMEVGSKLRDVLVRWIEFDPHRPG